MGIKIYGNAYSSCTQRVITVCGEKDLPYELVAINLIVAEQKSPSFLVKQPFGKIPVLEDDGYLVYESRAICKYLAAKYPEKGPKLMPQSANAKEFGLFEQACSIEQNYFNGPAEGIAYEKVFKPMGRLGDTDELLVAAYAKKLDTTLAVYETILSQQKYLAGDELTLADLYHLPYGKMVKELGYKQIFDKYQAVAKWMDDLEVRDSWKKATGINV